MHVLKSGVPPDKFRVLYRLLPIEFLGFDDRPKIHKLEYYQSNPIKSNDQTCIAVVFKIISFTIYDCNEFEFIIIYL